MDARVPLDTAVKALRSELYAAMEAGADEKLQFRLGPVELELGLEVSNEAGGDAGIRFWVVSLGGKAGRTSTSTHRVKLTLNPVSRTDEQVRIGSEGSDEID